MRNRILSHSIGAISCLLVIWEFAASQTAFAQTAAPQAETTRPPKPSSGTIDLQRSRIYVKVDKTGLGHEHGVVGQLSGGVVLLGQPQQAGWMKFDLRKFTADTADARRYVGLETVTDAATQQKVAVNMHGAQVLDVQNFPEATFVIQSAQRITFDDPSKALYELQGELNLHGVKRPLHFRAQGEIADGMILLRGNFPLLQTDFGIKPYTAALGAVGVADRLHVWGELWIFP